MNVLPVVELLGVVELTLLIVGAVDVWCHIWRTPKSRLPVNTGKSPARAPRYPR